MERDDSRDTAGQKAAGGGLGEVWICVSPKAGRGVDRDQIPALQQRLEASGIECRLTESVARLCDRLDNPAAEPGAGYPTESIGIVAAGGDGTLALVAQHTPPPVPIVPMPLGTENLVARYFGYSADAEQVFQTLVGGRDYSLDAGLAGGRLFLVMASAGFDAEVVRAVHLRRRGHIRRLAYAAPIIRAIRRYRFPLIEIAISDDAGSPQEDPIRARWGMVFNLPRYGGSLGIEPDAVGDDGRLDVIAFRRGSVWAGLRYVFGIATASHLRYRDVIRRRGGSITLTARGSVPYQLDGDYAGHLPVQIECLPGRVCLRLPRRPQSTKIRA